MVLIQLNIRNKLNSYLNIKKETMGKKDKREVIIGLLEESLSKDKELMKILEKNSVEV